MERMAKIDNFAYAGPKFLDKKMVSPSYIRSLGKVTREKSTVKMQYDRRVKYSSLTYEDGLEIDFRTFGKPEQTQILWVRVTSSKWPIESGLIIGAAADRVVALLGEPDERSDERLAYSGESEHVEFRVRAGYVVEIRFNYYSG